MTTHNTPPMPPAFLGPYVVRAYDQDGILRVHTAYKDKRLAVESAKRLSRKTGGMTFFVNGETRMFWKGERTK